VESGGLTPRIHRQRWRPTRFGRWIVGAAAPELNSLSCRELLDEWANLAKPDWINEHIAELRHRYELTI
jgi:hypothetical protein